MADLYNEKNVVMRGKNLKRENEMQTIEEVKKHCKFVAEGIARAVERLKKGAA